MNLHSLSNVTGARHRRMRVGRGESSGKGKTCGKGNKGQMSRTGHKRKPAFEGGQMRLIRRLPKRGFKSLSVARYAPVNVGELAALNAEEVTPAVLVQAGRVQATERVKVLGNGEASRKMTVKAHAFSASAKAKIEAAGGACEVITP